MKLKTNIMASGRGNKRVYTPEQILGMRIVAKICRDTRLSFASERNKASTLRGWVAFLNKEAVETFSHNDVSRYEAAGIVKDRRYETVNAIAPRYLAAIAPFTGYSEKALREYHDFGVSAEDVRSATSLKELVDDFRDKVGELKFKRLRNQWGLDDVKLDQATVNGIFIDNCSGAFSALLGIPIDEVIDAAIATIGCKTLNAIEASETTEIS